MQKNRVFSISRLGWALALAFGIFVYGDDSQAANRSPAIDRDASWSDEEYKQTESLLQSRSPAALSDSDLSAFFPGPGIDRAIRAALCVGSPAELPAFLIEHLKGFSGLARERIEIAASNPD